MTRILIFQHVAHEHPGMFTDILQSRQVHFDVLKLWEQTVFPDFKNYDGLIILGGPQSVYDDEKDFPTKNEEINAIKQFTAQHKPVLGICLGGQLIAAAFGGKVYKNIVDGMPVKETGFYNLYQTSAGKKDALFKELPDTFTGFEWHGDVFDIPKNAVTLVRGDLVNYQAFKINNTKTYGLLFHVEFTAAMITLLIDKDRQWLHTDNSVSEKEILLDSANFEKALQHCAQKILINWLKIKI